MRPERLLLPLLLAFALLFGQQGALLHALGHVLAQQSQQDKQAPHSPACEQCAAYAQLGGALNTSAHTFALDVAPKAAAQHGNTIFRSANILAAAARGPPARLHTIA